MTQMSEIEAGILQAIRDMKEGKAAKSHSAESLAARRRGRPPLPMVKVPVKIRLDADLLTTLRLSGAGWQTRINDTLRRQFMSTSASSSVISVIAESTAQPQDREVWLRGTSSSALMKPYYENKQFEGALIG